jgi:hypothetical protein
MTSNTARANAATAAAIDAIEEAHPGFRREAPEPADD